MEVGVITVCGHLVVLRAWECLPQCHVRDRVTALLHKMEANLVKVKYEHSVKSWL